MIDLGRFNVLGVLVNAVDYEAAAAAVINAAHKRQPLRVSALAVHGVMTGVLDLIHRYRLNHFDLIVPDGQPVRWALKWLHGANLPDRVYGPNLTLKVCDAAAQEGLPVYFYGSRPEVLEKLTANLKQKYPGLIIAGARPSAFRIVSLEEKNSIAAEICNAGAVIVFAGLGCPRQEVWVYENSQLLSMPVLAVGAAFDFHAGTLTQAPAVLQNSGLEWLFRLLREPSRLWKRYLGLNPLYLWLVFLQLLSIRVNRPEDSRFPESEIRYG